MEIIEIKKYLKNNKITYKKLSALSGIPLTTLKYIFSGRTSTPRIDTIQAIEKALNFDNQRAKIEPNFISDKQRLHYLIEQLPDELVLQVCDYIYFLLSKNSLYKL